MKFLEREGDGPPARYFNTPEGAMYLDPEASPRFILGASSKMLEMPACSGYGTDLPEALRTGQPQNEAKHGQKSIFETLFGANEPGLEGYLNAMTGLSRLNFETLAVLIDWSKFNTLCDIGGATGLLCLEVGAATTLTCSA